MFKEFKEFTIKGNMIDLAVGIIIGGAFGAVITSLVKDVIMPPIGALLGGVDFASKMWVIKEGASAAPYATPAAAAEAGAVVMSYGAFINTLVNFVIVALVIFFLVKGVNRLRKEAEPTTKECPYCKSEIALSATKCSECTSAL